jgi:hypothetical protein
VRGGGGCTKDHVVLDGRCDNVANSIYKPWKGTPVAYRLKVVVSILEFAIGIRRVPQLHKSSPTVLNILSLL